jgi:S-adenosylmethionine decarboxylase
MTLPLYTIDRGQMSLHVVCVACMSVQNCADGLVSPRCVDAMCCFEQPPRARLNIVAATMDKPALPASFSADLAGCEALPMLAADEVTELFVSALDRSGATVIDVVCHEVPRAEIVCVLILRDSHAVLHTWPETGTINIDIFSRTPRLKSLEAITELSQTFGARRMSIHEIARADGDLPRTSVGA